MREAEEELGKADKLSSAHGGEGGAGGGGGDGGGASVAMGTSNR